nr:hypothetical protein [Tanacetum cinerariifolium]
IGDTLVETHQTPIVDQPSTSKPQKKQNPRRKQRKEAEVSIDESEDEDHVLTPSSDPLPSSEDSFILNELMVFYTSLQEQRKSRSGGLRRLKKFRSGRRVKPPMEKDSLGAQEDASKQGRMIEEIDQNAEIALDDEIQGKTNDDEMFGVDDLAGEKVVMDTTTVTTTTVKDSAAPTTDVTEDDITMAQALAALKSIKPNVVVQEQKMGTIIPTIATIIITAVPTPGAKGIVFHEQKQSQIPIVSSSKDKGKYKMIKPEVPIKKKDKMRIDEEYARKLEAEEQEAARLSRAQQDEEANNFWDNIQAMMDADKLLAERLQARKREEFFEVQKARLLVELIEKRKKHFAALRAQEKRNKPPTKTQMKSQMSTYLKHICGYKQSHLKGRSFDEIKKLFDREMRKVNDFIAIDLEAQEISTKRTVEHLESDISKKQKVDENVKPVIDDFEELKKFMEIVPIDGDEVLIEATPLSSRSPTIIDYKIHKEGKKTCFKIIRADGNSQVYQTFEKMFKNFNREDLDVLWAIVKDRFKKEKLVDDMDNLLFRTLKTIFEHHVEDTIWKYQQGLAKIEEGHVLLFESTKGRVIPLAGVNEQRDQHANVEHVEPHDLDEGSGDAEMFWIYLIQLSFKKPRKIYKEGDQHFLPVSNCFMLFIYTEMDLFAFIHYANPTKVRISERQIEEGHVLLFESTKGRVIPLAGVNEQRDQHDNVEHVEPHDLDEGSGDAEVGDLKKLKNH